MIYFLLCMFAPLFMSFPCLRSQSIFLFSFGPFFSIFRQLFVPNGQMPKETKEKIAENNNRRAHDLPYNAFHSVGVRTKNEMAKIFTGYCYNVHQLVRFYFRVECVRCTAVRLAVAPWMWLLRRARNILTQRVHVSHEKNVVQLFIPWFGTCVVAAKRPQCRRNK